MAGVPPCSPCFFGARNLGRVLATLPFRVPKEVNQKQIKNNDVQKNRAKLDQKVPLEGARPNEKWVSFFGLF